MKFSQRNRAVLLLSDGTRFEGYAFGKTGTTTGELCFNTGMTGYQEIFTDPSYAGQLMVTTHTHIGNYGVHPREVESDRVQISGLVVRNFSQTFSREDASGSLHDYLVENGVPGIGGIDTRALVRHIRAKGAMNAVISSEIFEEEALRAILAACPSMEGLELSSQVTTREAYDFGNPEAPFRVAALDFGIKRSILQCMADRGCYVRVFPARTPLADLLAIQPHGIFLSNGPGDPAAMPWAIDTVKQILSTDKPLFGICLGHQLLCQALGIGTYKMFTGHRGINHPVKNLVSGLSEMTSQNHGFAVDMEAARASGQVEITHVNLNDHTLEGIRVKNRQAFSVQYHPEASPGPHDSRYLFDEFTQMMRGVPASTLA